MSNKTNADVVVVKTAFGPVVLPPQQANEPCSEEDIIDTLIVDGYEKDEAGNIKLCTKQIVTGKKNRKEYIESFADDVGLENILEKLAQGAISEEKYSILNGMSKGTVMDLTGFEGLNNLGDIAALADNARAIFERLDPELKKNMTFAEFCTNFNNADLDAYVQSKLAAANPNQDGGNI